MQRCPAPLKKRLTGRRGATTILVIALMIIFLMTAAFAVDGTYMFLVRSELRAATDAAAQAAAQQLSDEVRSQSATAGILNQQAVIDKAVQIALANSVAGSGLQLDTADIQLGRSTRSGAGKFNFVAGGLPFNSVRIVGRRDDASSAGNVGLFFGRALGISSFQPTEVSVGTFMQRNVMLVIDRSWSMKLDESDNHLYGGLTPDYGPESRITKVKQSLTQFLTFLQASGTTERLGVVSFASSVTHNQPLTDSLAAIEAAYNSLVPDGYTNIAGGILGGVSLMNADPQSQFVEKAIVVLTDGQENVGSDGIYYGVNAIPYAFSATAAAEQAAAQGFTIFAVTYCLDSVFARQTMENVAGVGGGKCYHAADQADLNVAFSDIALTMSTMLTE